MFFDHFHMTTHPFTENPPSDWIMTDERFEMALARLQVLQNQAALAMIVGPTGVGKTSFVKLFHRNLPRHSCQAFYINLCAVSATALLRLMVAAMGEATKMGKDRLMLQIIERARKHDGQTLFIIDEAHLLSSQSLIDLRLLAASNQDERSSIKFILCGQESLAATLKRSAHADLLHRIGPLRVHLKPFNHPQTAAYIKHRLRRADGPDRLFDADAIQLIHDYSGGVPRQINNIATACLFQAMALNLQLIDAKIAHQIMAEFQLP